MKIAIVGATGNVGGHALGQLMTAEVELVALVRDPNKLPAAARERARVERGDLADGAFVSAATLRADALLWLTPPQLTAPDLREYTLALAANAARAIRDNAIPRVVVISSHGADRGGLGHVSFAGEVEKLLAAAAPHSVALRSAGFMENLLGSLETLRSGLLVGALPPDKKYPLVATRDVGGVAARWLLDRSWSGHQVRGVHGPTDLSAEEQVTILASVLERTVDYRQVPPEAVRDTLLKRGASASVAAAYCAMFASFARPDYRPTEERTTETTTGTTLETFAREVLTPRLCAAQP